MLLKSWRVLMAFVMVTAVKIQMDLEDLYNRSRVKDLVTEVKRRIMIGTYVLSAGYYDAYYLKAQKIRH